MSALLWWCDFAYTICRVTLPTERVSWNWLFLRTFPYCQVTLPTERVSWNAKKYWQRMFNVLVTLPTERVSWNCFHLLLQWCHTSSRSPRSVWVEITFSAYYCCRPCHAPHGACELKLFIFLSSFACPSHAPHGACELKWDKYIINSVNLMSRSPRSVWVEIFLTFVLVTLSFVTLPTERVSWNLF